MLQRPRCARCRRTTASRRIPASRPCSWWAVRARVPTTRSDGPTDRPPGERSPFANPPGSAPTIGSLANDACSSTSSPARLPHLPSAASLAPTPTRTPSATLSGSRKSSVGPPGPLDQKSGASSRPLKTANPPLRVTVPPRFASRKAPSSLLPPAKRTVSVPVQAPVAGSTAVTPASKRVARVQLDRDLLAFTSVGEQSTKGARLRILLGCAARRRRGSTGGRRPRAARREHRDQLVPLEESVGGPSRHANDQRLRQPWSVEADRGDPAACAGEQVAGDRAPPPT